MRLSEKNTVAHRFTSFGKGIVFTERPIPLGTLFQVRLLDKGGRWIWSIVSPFNNLSADDLLILLTLVSLPLSTIVL